MKSSHSRDAADCTPVKHSATRSSAANFSDVLAQPTGVQFFLPDDVGPAMPFVGKLQPPNPVSPTAPPSDSRRAGYSPIQLSASLNPVRKGGFMLARVVEVAIKGGKKRDVLSILQNELMPLLHKQPGFVSFEALARDTDPNITFGITYWENKDYAETCYSMPAYTQILNRIRPLLSNDVKPVLYHVDISTTHRVATSKAA
jgi:quinol monooxygenase YgiN